MRSLVLTLFLSLSLSVPVPLNISLSITSVPGILVYSCNSTIIPKKFNVNIINHYLLYIPYSNFSNFSNIVLYSSSFIFPIHDPVTAFGCHIFSVSFNLERSPYTQTLFCFFFFFQNINSFRVYAISFEEHPTIGTCLTNFSLLYSGQRFLARIPYK